MLDQALGGIQANIRRKIVESYLALKRNLAEGRHEAAGLGVGKFCEGAIRHLQKATFGQSTPFGRKIPNFADECRRIITSSGGSLSDSEKLVIPRALVFLYTMRNTRGIGHIGGDIDANAIDSATMGRVADWILCEFIRVHHGLSLEEAQNLVDSLAVRTVPDVWEVNEKRRILRKGLKARDETLLLLYSCTDQAVLTEDLISWVEYSNPRAFKATILGKLHRERFLEWDREVETVTLSPKGAKYVEEQLLGH